MYEGVKILLRWSIRSRIHFAPTRLIVFLPVNKPPEPDRSQRAADGRADKIRLRTHAPQPCAEKGTARHRAVADEIIRAVSPRAQFRRGLADDERLARRFAELLDKKS